MMLTCTCTHSLSSSGVISLFGISTVLFLPKLIPSVGSIISVYIPGRGGDITISSPGVGPIIIKGCGGFRRSPLCKTSHYISLRRYNLDRDQSVQRRTCTLLKGSLGRVHHDGCGAYNTVHGGVTRTHVVVVVYYPN